MNCCNGIEENTASTLCNPCPYEYNCTKCKEETDKLAQKLHKAKQSCNNGTWGDSMDILDEYEKYIENKIAKLNDMQNKTREETYMVDLLPVILEYMKEIRNRIEK